MLAKPVKTGLSEYLTFVEFLEQAVYAEPRRPRGQAIHNLLYIVRRDLWDRMQGTKLDPFEDDSRVAHCLDWLEWVWDDDPWKGNS